MSITPLGSNPLGAGIVSYSSRIIAAMRAIEDEEPDKLFDDPLARVLAGDKAMKRVYQLLKVQLITACKPARPDDLVYWRHRPWDLCMPPVSQKPRLMLTLLKH